MHRAIALALHGPGGDDGRARARDHCPDGRADQQLHGGSVGRGPGRFRRQLLEPGDPQRLAPQRVPARYSVDHPEHAHDLEPAGRGDQRLVPTSGRYGVARSDSGVASNLATGVSFRLSDDSPTTFGIGVFGLVGASVNYAGSQTTPILTPRQPPNFFGVGPIYASSTFLAIMLTGSRQVTDRLAIGGGPMVVTGPAAFNPAFFAPGPADASGLPTFPRPRTPGPSGARGSSSACSITSTTTGTSASRTRARSGRSGTGSIPRFPIWPRGGSASRRRCPRSSRGASPTRASSGP